MRTFISTLCVILIAGLALGKPKHKERLEENLEKVPAAGQQGIERALENTGKLKGWQKHGKGHPGKGHDKARGKGHEKARGKGHTEGGAGAVVRDKAKGPPAHAGNGKGKGKNKDKGKDKAKGPPVNAGQGKNKSKAKDKDKDKGKGPPDHAGGNADPEKGAPDQAGGGPDKGPLGKAGPHGGGRPDNAKSKGKGKKK
jgi:hypothetical protein